LSHEPPGSCSGAHYACVIGILKETLAREEGIDFSDLVGRWTPDPAFDEILAAQRQIDFDKWPTEELPPFGDPC
jgi:hypothetical protein